ncbi:hypothetical protein Csa_018478 [Cucumis sativus]|uniref:Uncharacterized protein n=1 Tax=Cucumis sativus TaxID=3659 RepID=A0A0A0KMR0_CUCSA|nr:hypothetical protein Csa_018478 [Cucumis sativus]
MSHFSTSDTASLQPLYCSSAQLFHFWHNDSYGTIHATPTTQESTDTNNHSVEHATKVGREQRQQYRARH